MREDIIKAYDILKEEQRNADGKANLFIIIISAVIAFISEIPSSIYNQEQLVGMQYLFLFLLVPLLLFVWSLVPIYSDKFLIGNSKRIKKTNIFYWRRVFPYYCYKDFEKAYMKRYSIDKLEVLDKDLLKQVFANSNIMANKSYTHKIAFYILGHILVFIVLGFIAEYLIGYNFWTVFLFVLIELVYTEKLFSPIKKVVKFFKKKV